MYNDRGAVCRRRLKPEETDIDAKEDAAIPKDGAAVGAVAAGRGDAAGRRGRGERALSHSGGISPCGRFDGAVSGAVGGIAE